MWKEEHNTLVREFEFSDFKQAFAFMTQVALLAEQQGHHPKMENVYNRLRLELTTHDTGNTITEKDRKLAKSIDAIK
jgi:4a-hydroxytetrahydrobiopterin dehydratase